MGPRPAPLHQAAGRGPAGQLIAVGQLELAQYGRDVALDGLDGDEQLTGALPLRDRKSVV